MAVVALAAIAAVAITVRTRASASEDVWRRKSQLDYSDATVGRESLATLADLTRSTSDEQFVLLGLAEQGQQALYLSTMVAMPPDRELNEMAKSAFAELLERFPNNPMVIGIAHAGLATAAENDFALDGDVGHRAEAEKQLQAIVNDPALDGMPFKRLAMDRLNRLDETFTETAFSYPAPPPDEIEEPIADEAGPVETGVDTANEGDTGGVDPADAPGVDPADDPGVDSADDPSVDSATPPGETGSSEDDAATPPAPAKTGSDTDPGGDKPG